MTKFTAKENATRKEVFNYNRKLAAHKVWDSCTKTFGKSKAVLRAIEESDRRIANNRPNPSEFEMFKQTVMARAKSFASCLPSSGYSMGEDKYIYCRILRDTVSHADCCQEYAKSCKWSAKHGSVMVELPLSIIGKAENMNGMITIRTKQVQQRIWKAQWVVFDYTRDGRGFINSDITYHMESGYVVRYENGRSRHLGSQWELAGHNYEAGWYHTATLADARKKLPFYLRDEKFYAKWAKWDAKESAAQAKREAKRQQQEAKRREQEARERAKAAKKLEQQKKQVEKSQELKDIVSHMYVYQDSIKAGNCIPGTNAFLQNHNLQKTDTRSGEFLLRISRNSWQHSNVVRILTKYAAETHPAFYETYHQTLTSILNTL